MITHVTASCPATQQRLNGFIDNLINHGSNYLKAAEWAIQALENTIVRQTYLLRYMDAFLLLALMNAGCILLVIMTIRKRKAGSAPKTVVVSDD